MERLRRRRAHARVSSHAKVTTIVDRSSDDFLITSHRKENQLIGKQNLPSLAFDCSSCSSGVTAEEDLLSLDLETSNSRLPTGTPMKLLLAHEMSKETESKSQRRSPSVVARLMGLDGLPAQQNTNRQQKRPSNNCHQNRGSAGFRKSSKLYDSRSDRKNAREQQQFKDVYEVVESSDMDTRSCASRAAFDANPSDDEIAFIRQKFMDVKRHCTDENLQHSKEFHDALEVLDSNKDLLLKFLQEPDSLFGKHLHDLHGAPESHFGRVLSMKSTNTLKSNIDAIGWQSGGEASRKIDISHSNKHTNGYYSGLYNKHNVDSHELNFQAEGEEAATSTSTRIVVLKPNLGKVQNTARSVSSPSPCDPVSNAEMHSECSNVMNSGSATRGRMHMHNGYDIYGSKSKEARVLAKEITRHMRNKLGLDSFNVSFPGYKGYLADESSHDLSGNDSSYESEMIVASPQTPFNRNIHKKASVLHQTESSVNREAKKRLSERWKMTHRSQEIKASGMASTLAEMLAMPDVDIRPRDPHTVVADDWFHRFQGNYGTAESITPLGISSRDGWKDGCIQNLSRSRSLPASSHIGSPKSSIRREPFAAERFQFRKEGITHMRSKAMKMDFERKDGSFSGSVKPNRKKSHSSYPMSTEMRDDIQEVRLSGNMMMDGLDGKDLPEVKGVILEMSPCRHDMSLTLDAVVDKEHRNVFEDLRSPDEYNPAPEMPLHALSQDDSSRCNLASPQKEPSKNKAVGGSSYLQCAATVPESSASGNEAEQPSPVSVLEAPFVEDTSSGSECFERVSAELHGLRMQLTLLKQESEAYDEGSMLVSSNEDVVESMELHFDKGFLGAGENWDFSYLVDVLTESGLDETDPDLFLGTWHSLDCPIALWVFDNLEKRYCEQDSCSRSERRLLFDRINSRITEISQQFVGPQMWLKPLKRNVGLHWQEEGLKTELLKLLESHDMKVAEDAVDMVILDSMRWLELGDHIDAVGRDIEGLLIDELVAELLPV